MLSVEADHERSTRTGLTGVAVTLPGTVGSWVSEDTYLVPVPTSLIAPTRLPVKSFVPTTVRLQSELEMFSPYFCVFTAWLSVAVFSSTTLSLQLMLSAAPTRIPSLLETSSELFVIVLPETRFRSLLLILTPFSPELSMTLPVMTLSLDFLFGWGALVEDLVASTPSPPVFVIVQPSTRLLLAARNWTPSLGTPLITQSRTTLRFAVQPVPLPSKMIPFPREATTFTRSTRLSFP